jgi:hypothetical protein
VDWYTSYSLRAEPPVDDGAVHDSFTAPPGSAVAVTPVGEPGVDVGLFTMHAAAELLHSFCTT